MIQLINRDNPHIRIIADDIDKTVNDEYGILMNGITFGFTKGNWELKEYKEPRQLEWSEEDERIRKVLLNYHKNAPEQYTCGGLTNAKVAAWLESLKDRFNSQPQLTEFEEKMYSILSPTSDPFSDPDIKDFKKDCKLILELAKKELEK